MKQIHAIVSGRVQGVGFRNYTEMMAKKENVVGWVQNRTDGAVEITAQATDQELDAFLTKIKSGPNFFSKVKNMEVKEEAIETVYDNFEIKY